MFVDHSYSQKLFILSAK